MNVNRQIVRAMLETVNQFPILALTGPRQSGKTTLLKSLFPNYEYVSLENPDIRNFAESDPNGFLDRYSNSIIFDEIQRVPTLFSYLQTKVDNSGIMGQFILSGSQNFHLIKGITQSLAGRVAMFKLLPFDFQELKSSNLLSEDYLENIVKGFYPAIYDRNISSKTFYYNYIQTYIERDVSELIAIKDKELFRNFLGLCATRAGQLLNMNSLANECGISQPTAKAWLSILQSSYIVFLLQPFHENLSKRIVKTPKLFFYDTGLVCFLLKMSEVSKIIQHPIKGNLFENMMIAEYVKQIHHTYRHDDIWFWRDSAGREVDLIVQDESSFLKLIEMKSSKTIMSDDFNGLTYFELLSKRKDLTKSLVYGGNENQERSLGNIISWKDFGK